MDRFRSLPMARSAVLAGRMLADVGRERLPDVVMLVVAHVVGFRFSTSVPEVVLGLALLLLMGYAFSWISAIIGMSLNSIEAAQSAGSSGCSRRPSSRRPFVPTDSMPAVLEWFAEVNPITIWVNAARAARRRAARRRGAAGPAPGRGVVAVFAPLSVARYRRIATA